MAQVKGIKSKKRDNQSFRWQLLGPRKKYAISDNNRINPIIWNLIHEVPDVIEAYEAGLEYWQSIEKFKTHFTLSQRILTHLTNFQNELFAISEVSDRYSLEWIGGSLSYKLLLIYKTLKKNPNLENFLSSKKEIVSIVRSELKNYVVNSQLSEKRILEFFFNFRSRSAIIFLIDGKDINIPSFCDQTVAKFINLKSPLVISEVRKLFEEDEFSEIRQLPYSSHFISNSNPNYAGYTLARILWFAFGVKDYGKIYKALRILELDCPDLNNFLPRLKKRPVKKENSK